MRYADLEGQKSKPQNRGPRAVHKSRLSSTNVRSVPYADFFQGLLMPFQLLFKRWKLLFTILVVAGVGLGGWYGYSAMKSLNVKAGDLINVPGAAVDFVTKKGPQLDNLEGRTNILLLGIGGEGHEGPYLTDSIMVASADLETGDVVLISLPRDIWVTGARAKINAVYAFARQKSLDEGLPAARKAVEEVLGIPMHYAVRIDFKGFERAIDLIDGVEVDVARAFVDNDYPIAGQEEAMCGLTEVEVEVTVTPTPAASGSPVPEATQTPEGTTQKVKRLVDAQGNDKTDDPLAFACRYETIRFNVGRTIMDGKTALKFVRSRHGNNNEGSDFARADRQQRVITAFRNEVLSAGTLLNPARMTSLINEFGKSIETDVKVDDYGEFVKLAQLSKDAEIKTHTVTGEGVDALLVTPPSREPYGGAYVLVPKGGKWETVHVKVKDWLLGVDPSPSPSPSASASITQKPI